MVLPAHLRGQRTHNPHAYILMIDTLRLEPAARPYVDTGLFRDAMVSTASTVCVVAAMLDGERRGRTVTSMFSLSVEPPTILVSIGKGSPLADHIARAGGFSLAVLAEGQRAVADVFAARDRVDRFATGQWSSWNSGHPRLADAVTAMDCVLVGAIETGTHMLFAGGVVEVETFADRTPLVWHQRDYRPLAGQSRLPVDA